MEREWFLHVPVEPGHARKTLAEAARGVQLETSDQALAGRPVSLYLGQTAGRQRIIMLEEIKRLFADLRGGGKHAHHFDDNDYRVAAAALLVHVATLEGDLSAAARDKLRAILKARFSLTDELTDELIEAAAAADREAVDFYHFTNLLMRTLNEQGRLQVVEMLWEIAFVDGAISEFEDNVMWRVADLLAVSPRERIALRQRVVGKKFGKEGQ
jgi:uncharacterized tellurite resistance protein B-like protein